MTIRPNYYRVRVRARAILPEGVANERRASTLVEVECQDLIEALGLDFNTGNALKYLFRAGKKSPTRLEDMRKVLTYAGFAVEAEERATRPTGDAS